MFHFHFHSVCASICLPSLPSLSVTHVFLSYCLPCRQPPPPQLPPWPLSIGANFHFHSYWKSPANPTTTVVTQKCSSTHNNNQCEPLNHMNPSYLAMTCFGKLFIPSFTRTATSFFLPLPFTTASVIMPSCRGDDVMQTSVPSVGAQVI